VKKQLILFVGLFFALTMSAAAQDAPKAEVFGGYSYLRANPGLGAPGFNLNGGSGSVAANITPMVGIVGDFGGYYAPNIYNSGLNGNILSYMGGPRLTLRREKLSPFVQGLFGGVRASVSGSSSNSFAMALGGGVDLNVTNRIAIRLVQAEYLMTRFNIVGVATNQNNARISTGIVFRFGR
jgi:opacity protein-like surface antigen